MIQGRYGATTSVSPAIIEPSNGKRLSILIYCASRYSPISIEVHNGGGELLPCIIIEAGKMLPQFIEILGQSTPFPYLYHNTLSAGSCFRDDYRGR